MLGKVVEDYSMDDDTPLTVGDLVRVLSRLPPDAELHLITWDARQPTRLRVRDFDEGGPLFVRRDGDRVRVCFEYDSGARGEALDFTNPPERIDTEVGGLIIPSVSGVLPAGDYRVGTALENGQLDIDISEDKETPDANNP